MDSTRNNQARLRLVVDNRDFSDDPRKNAQSAFGQSASQRTLPPDSRSISIARDSRQARDPYAMLAKCPAVVPHLVAKVSRSGTVMSCQKALNSMPDYHHTVNINATPFGEFTKWCNQPDNRNVTKSSPVAAIRRENLQ